MTTESNLKNKLTATKAPRGGTSIVDYLNNPATQAQLQRAAAANVKPDRLMRLALSLLRTNPRLAESTPQSILACLMTSAQLGLEPGPLGQCYYVPYRNKHTGTTECQFQLGYIGIIELARRSGQLLSIDAHVVYEHDQFSYSYGLHPDLKHVPAENERGDIRFFYAVAHFKDGGYVFNVMSVSDVDKVRKRSQASKTGPWVTDYEAMGLKTAIKSLRKFLPLTVEAQTAMAVEDQEGMDIRSALVDLDTGECYDVEPEDETDEPIEEEPEA